RRPSGPHPGRDPRPRARARAARRRARASVQPRRVAASRDPLRFAPPRPTCIRFGGRSRGGRAVVACESRRRGKMDRWGGPSLGGRSSTVHARTRSILASLAVVVALVIATPGGAARHYKVSARTPHADKVILFASDGMRPDLMEQYAADGLMPTYSDLMAKGVRGDNGLTQAFPPNTGVGWFTLATGAYPGEHGSMNNPFHRVGEANFNNRTSFAGGILQADTIANAAERAGKKVAQIEWVGGRSANITGPTVDFANFFSTRGVLAAPLNATEQAGAASFGISYQVASFAPASGWSNVPAGDPVAPPQQTQLTIATTFGAQNTTPFYDVYVSDSNLNGTAGYDHTILVRSAAAKDGAQKSVDLAVGDF